MNTWADTYLYFVVEFVLSSSGQHFQTVSVYSLARVCRFFPRSTGFSILLGHCLELFFTFSLVIYFFFFIDGWFNRENWPPWTLFHLLDILLEFENNLLEWAWMSTLVSWARVSLKTTVSQNKVLCACLKYLGARVPRGRIPFHEA